MFEVSKLLFVAAYFLLTNGITVNVSTMNTNCYDTFPNTSYLEILLKKKLCSRARPEYALEISRIDSLFSASEGTLSFRAF